MVILIIYQQACMRNFNYWLDQYISTNARYGIITLDLSGLLMGLYLVDYSMSH